MEASLQIFRNTKKLNLSEQHILDATNRNEYDNGGCSGGYVHRTFHFIAKTGIAAEQHYPYVSGDSGEVTISTYQTKKVKSENQ